MPPKPALLAQKQATATCKTLSECDLLPALGLLAQNKRGQLSKSLTNVILIVASMEISLIIIAGIQPLTTQQGGLSFAPKHIFMLK